jgi:hypothetical protein
LENQKKLYIFGDGELVDWEPLIYFRERKIACNYSECGCHIASKNELKEEPIVIPLKELVKQLDPDTMLISWNCGIYWFLQNNGIKTVRDLAKYFNIEL